MASDSAPNPCSEKFCVHIRAVICRVCVMRHVGTLVAVSIGVPQSCKGQKKVKQSHNRPRGFQQFEAPRFQDNEHMKVVRLSALGTGRLYPPGNIHGTHFC
jgi:hypothetical protein